MVVAAYVEKLLRDGLSKPTVKQHLAAIRMLFDWMVVGGILAMNPASAVRGPKYVIRKGKTPVLTPEEARLLLDSIDVTELKGLRDRSLLAVMVYSFARVSAVVGMNVEDYYQQGKRWWLRLHEKGGKHHELPVHHKSEEYLDTYLRDAAIADQKGSPLWRSMTKERGLSESRMSRQDVFRMIKRRCYEAELGAAANCHTFRATGITAYLLNGGTLEHAQAIAAHESPRTTKLYDRTSDEITLDEIERIGI
jgi:integrase/recombinase XerD